MNIRAIAIAALITPLLALAPAANADDGGYPSSSWSPNPDKAATMKACRYEDSKNCVWDAWHRGNGEGKSFRVTKKGKVIHISHRRAHFLVDGYFRMMG